MCTKFHVNLSKTVVVKYAFKLFLTQTSKPAVHSYIATSKCLWGHEDQSSNDKGSSRSCKCGSVNCNLAFKTWTTHVTTRCQQSTFCLQTTNSIKWFGRETIIPMKLRYNQTLFTSHLCSSYALNGQYFVSSNVLFNSKLTCIRQPSVRWETWNRLEENIHKV